MPSSTPGQFVRSGEYFLDEFFNNLARGENVKNSFVKARDLIKVKDTRKLKVATFRDGVWDRLMQHPLLDDNSDQIGTFDFNVGSDGTKVAALSLGEGAVVTNAADNPGDITSTTPTTFLAATTSNADLWLKANVNSRVDAAWAEIRKPDTAVTGTGGTGQVIIDMDTVAMTFNATTGRWEGSYSGFGDPGAYDVYYYTHDSLTDDISPMVVSRVYKDQAGNTPPAAFSLLTPEDNSGGSVIAEKTFLALTWGESSDSDGLTYTVEISKDSTFATVDYRQEGVGDTMAVIPEGALQDFSTYHWRVSAIDEYGQRTASSQSYSFKTDNTNGLTGMIYGFILDSVTGQPIVGATVSINGVIGAAMSSNGAYLAVKSSGSNYTVTVSKAGYIDKEASMAVEASKVTTANFYLASASTPDACNDGAVTIADVQSAINMFLGLKTPSTCVNTDGNNSVSISEVQKVVNSFLGL